MKLNVYIAHVANGFLVRRSDESRFSKDEDTFVARDLAELNKILSDIAGEESATSASDVKIDEMVNRFLSWRLPPSFFPDGGVKFTPPTHPTNWPTGTNLLDAAQAREMLEHVLGVADIKGKS